MGYRTMGECVADLERRGMLCRIEVEIDPVLEMGEIQRRVYRQGGPALLFTRPRGCRFPMLGNLFGTLERTRFIFRDALPVIEGLVRCAVDPREILRRPALLARLVPPLFRLLPRFVADGPVRSCSARLSDLPRLVSWPGDGGPFITLPQVYTESPASPGLRHGNLGMYRIQLSGNRYEQDREVGIHYQIHRGIGIHHQEALERGETLRVAVSVGGPPALAVASVMPLPEGVPELFFASLLAGHRIPLIRREGELPIPAEADFVITGTIDPRQTLPEGPFGDHLGYYSLVHDFPVIRVERVWHRPDPVWPFTTVGRPPQEDTSFGTFIHELTDLLIPRVLPGVRRVHAVDAAGVHPLLLAIGSERYLPYSPLQEPMELLTQANAILGQGQLSLAKYLLIAAEQDSPPDIHDIPAFFMHILQRVDWRRDLHFQTRTTIDTLDYSGDALNRGSKVVIAAVGPPRRHLPAQLPPDLTLPAHVSDPRVVFPGVLAITTPPCRESRHDNADPDMLRFCGEVDPSGPLSRFPLIVMCDDSRFVADSIDNFLWVTFTRSNPAADIYGIGAEMVGRHWGCRGALVIDARVKPHHAPILEMDPAVSRRVDELAAPGGALHGLY